MARTLKEKATDCLLTIYLVHDAFSRENVRFLHETRLQKLVFLSEKMMIDERKKGFNFYFIKLIHGPFSQELKNGYEKLVETGFLQDFGLKPTDSAKLILQDFHDVLKRNRPFLDKINEVNDNFATMDLQPLLRRIYAMRWGRGNKTIADLPQRTPMLYPMKPDKVLAGFEITDEEVQDLLMNFDVGVVKELILATEQMRTGQRRTHEQVFSGL